MKKAIIVGCNGQDGRLLSGLLLNKGYGLLGIDKEFINCPEGFHLSPVDIKSPKEVFNLIDKFKPNEIYYLAAFHHSSEDSCLGNVELLEKSYGIHVLSFFNFLEGIKQLSPETKIFYAASSHIFGEPSDLSQDENTPINPNNIYGLTKAAGLFACRIYRNQHALYASAGILYNHESCFRKEPFVSKKIIVGAINIKKRKQNKLVLGDLNAEIDWGYANDYVEAMFRILQAKDPDDFIIASGEKHTVLDFVKIAFGYLDIDWCEHVEEEQSIIKKTNHCRVGNSEKLRKVVGWKPSVDFNGMIRALLESEGAFN